MQAAPRSIILCTLLLSLPFIRILSTLPLRFDPVRVRETTLERSWNHLELGGVTRGNTARRSNDFTSATPPYLYLTPIYFYTRRSARVDRDAATVRRTAIFGGDLVGFPSPPCPPPSLSLFLCTIPGAKQDETFLGTKATRK